MKHRASNQGNQFLDKKRSNDHDSSMHLGTSKGTKDCSLVMSSKGLKQLINRRALKTSVRRSGHEDKFGRELALSM